MTRTNDAAKLPTRTALRRTATRTRAAVRERAATAAVVLSAAVTFALGAAVLAAALALAVTTLTAHLVAPPNAHPVALLAGAFVATFGLYTLPLLALRAAVRTARTTRAIA